MTKEEKQLLVKDLCARLPYWVICDMWFEGNESDKITEVLKCGGLMRLMTSEYNFIAKPYLRPMSSMTRDESFELDEILIDLDSPSVMMNVIDFYNAHHFDYHDLIEKGLAIEAPEGMYK